MRKVVALLIMAFFIFTGCTVAVKQSPSDQRSIERSKEAHRDLEKRTGN